MYVKGWPCTKLKMSPKKVLIHYDHLKSNCLLPRLGGGGGGFFFFLSIPIPKPMPHIPSPLLADPGLELEKVTKYLVNFNYPREVKGYHGCRCTSMLVRMAPSSPDVPPSMALGSMWWLFSSMPC